MRDDDTRGTRRTLPPAATRRYPHLALESAGYLASGRAAVRCESSEGKGERTALRRRLRMKIGLDVHGLLFFFTSLYVCAADGA